MLCKTSKKKRFANTSLRNVKFIYSDFDFSGLSTTKALKGRGCTEPWSLGTETALKPHICVNFIVQTNESVRLGNEMAF